MLLLSTEVCLPKVTFPCCGVVQVSLVLLCAGLHDQLTSLICLQAKRLKAICQVVHTKVRELIPNGFLLFLVMLDFEDKWKCPILVLHVHISTPIFVQLVSNHS